MEKNIVIYIIVGIASGTFSGVIAGIVCYFITGNILPISIRIIYRIGIRNIIKYGNFLS